MLIKGEATYDHWDPPSSFFSGPPVPSSPAVPCLFLFDFQLFLFLVSPYKNHFNKQKEKYKRQLKDICKHSLTCNKQKLRQVIYDLTENGDRRTGQE